MATTDLILSDFGRPIRCSAQAAAVLNARLQKVAPGDLSPEEKRALKLVGERAAEVAEVQSARDRLSQTKLRPVLAVYVNGFNALHDSLVAVGRVPAEVSDRGERATSARTSLFPDGLSFLALDAESAWAEGQRRIDRIKSEGLRGELEELVGKDVLETLLKGVQKLADAIGTGRSRAVPSTTALQEALVRIGRAVGAYGRVMAGRVDEDDPASVERFMIAMGPIELQRAAMARGSNSAGEEDEEPTQPASPSVVGIPSPVASPTANGIPSPIANGIPAPIANGIPAPTTLNGAPAPTTLNGVPAPMPTDTPHAA